MPNTIVPDKTHAAIDRHTAQAMDAVIGVMHEPPVEAEPEVAPLTAKERVTVDALYNAISDLDVFLGVAAACLDTSTTRRLEQQIAEAAGRAKCLYQIASALRWAR